MNGSFWWKNDPFSHNHGSVENYPDWKESSLGLPQFFHWTMIVGTWVYKTLDMDDTRRGPLVVESGVFNSIKL